MVLQDPLVLQLVKGDRVTILDEHGTRELRGPSKFTTKKVTSTTPGQRMTWRSITAPFRRVRAAGVRGKEDLPPLLPPVTRQTDLWLIDPLIPGHWCALDLKHFSFWRYDPDTSVDLKVQVDGIATQRAWPSGQRQLEWTLPSAMADNTVFTVSIGRGKPTRIAIHQLSAPTSLSDLANQIAAKKCYPQLGILLRE